MIKTCQRCGTEFNAYGSSKYCLFCRDEVKIEKQHEIARRYYYYHLKEIYARNRRRYRQKKGGQS